MISSPPWWNAERARNAMVVLGAALWIGLLRRQVERKTVQLEVQIRDRQQAELRHACGMERSRIARDLHDELGTALTHIGLLSTLATHESTGIDRARVELKKISKETGSLVGALDEIV